jgi:xanthine dehydrogenase/oxidase
VGIPYLREYARLERISKDWTFTDRIQNSIRCGFCTPGIVMSLYALVRNSYNPTTKCFHLSETDIEKEGHLDGNLCRCTGYKPILKAAKTFVVDDLKGKLFGDSNSSEEARSREDDQNSIPYRSEMANGSLSCGRPGGCCRDTKIPPAGLGSWLASGASSSDEIAGSLESNAVSSTSSIESSREDEIVLSLRDSFGKTLKFQQAAIPSDNIEGRKAIDSKPSGREISGVEHRIPFYNFKPYSPQTELLFPPTLRKCKKLAICFGNSKQLWLRPVTLQQLLDIKNVYPPAKLVGGSSEVQVEVRFKESHFKVLVYVSEIDGLKGINVPEEERLVLSMSELVIGANTSLSDIEASCKSLYSKLGRRAQVLEATRKQLRYFGGRQIRNVASLAGSIATASPISDMNPVLLAAGAAIGIQSNKEGSSKLPLSKFLIGYRRTTLPVDAIITHIYIPLARPGAREVIKAYKQAKRKDDDIAIVTAAFRVRLREDNSVEDVVLAYGGMANKTVEAAKTMKSLCGRLASHIY